MCSFHELILISIYDKINFKKQRDVGGQERQGMKVETWLEKEEGMTGQNREKGNKKI